MVLQGRLLPRHLPGHNDTYQMAPTSCQGQLYGASEGGLGEVAPTRLQKNQEHLHQSTFWGPRRPDGLGPAGHVEAGQLLGPRSIQANMNRKRIFVSKKKCAPVGDFDWGQNCHLSPEYDECE